MLRLWLRARKARLVAPLKHALFAPLPAALAQYFAHPIAYVRLDAFVSIPIKQQRCEELLRLLRCLLIDTVAISLKRGKCHIATANAVL